jgi:hypothetical protein
MECTTLKEPDCLMEVAAWAGLTVINHSVNYTRFMLFMCNIIQINLDMYTNIYPYLRKINHPPTLLQRMGEIACFVLYTVDRTPLQN